MKTVDADRGETPKPGTYYAEVTIGLHFEAESLADAFDKLKQKIEIKQSCYSWHAKRVEYDKRANCKGVGDE